MLPRLPWAALLTAAVSALPGTAPAGPDAREAWEELRRRALVELSRKPEPVPLPRSPSLAAPRYTLHRLVDDFPRAHVESDWQPSAAPVLPLVQLGPFRSDRPTPDFRVARHWDEATGEHVEMLATGFRIDREEIGSIAVDVRAPFGRHLELVWEFDQSSILPVPDNTSFWSLSMTTDGLLEWTGPLEAIRLRSDGIGNGAIEIPAIQLLGHASRFPDAADTCRPAVSGRLRDAIYVRPGTVVTFPPTRIPDHARLRFGVAAVALDGESEAAGGSGDVGFEVLVRSDQATKLVAERRPELSAPWEDVTVSMEEWAGRSVSLVLRTTGSPEGRVGLWADPVVYRPVEEPPLLVIYVIDTLSAHHLRPYGYDRSTTPRLEALASEGAWFPDMRSNGGWTAESIPHLMLSMPTASHGVFQPSTPLPEELVTMADALRAGGFATAAFVTNVFVGSRQNLDQGFDHFSEEHSASFRNPEIDRTVPIDDVLDWVKDHADVPAFVYVHTAEPHFPYTPPEGFRTVFDPDYPGACSADRVADLLACCRTERDLEHIVALYDEEILYADHRFGEFRDALEEAGFSARTTFLVLSDHGEELKEHGLFGHRLHVHEEIARVPLIAAGPLVKARGPIDLPVSTFDLFPTVLDLLSLPEPYDLEGSSFAPVLNGESRRSPFPENRYRVITHTYSREGIPEIAISEGTRWKLMLTHSGYAGAVLPGSELRFLLYDLREDPFETRDVLDEHPDVARRLLEKLEEAHARWHPFEDTAPERLMFDPAQLEELRSLGYLGGR